MKTLVPSRIQAAKLKVGMILVFDGDVVYITWTHIEKGPEDVDYIRFSYYKLHTRGDMKPVWFRGDTEFDIWETKE